MQEKNGRTRWVPGNSYRKIATVISRPDEPVTWLGHNGTT
jgi:hypothetical protein